MLADHKRLRNAADIVLADRMQQEYPGLACDFVEQVFTVTNPAPKTGHGQGVLPRGSPQKVRLRSLARDGWQGLRAFR